MPILEKRKKRGLSYFVIIPCINIYFLFISVACIPNSPSESSKNFSITRITFDSYDDVECRVNASGNIVWVKEIDDWCEIYRFTPGSAIIEEISYNPYRGGNPQINNRGDVAWWQYDGLGEEADAEIYSYFVEEGRTIRFTDNAFHDFHPRLNNNGDMVWYGAGCAVPDNDDDEIYLYTYSSGQLEQVTGTTEEGTIEEMISYSYPDLLPQINDKMDLVWQAGAMREDGMTCYEICCRFAGSAQTYLTEVWDEYTISILPQINNNCDVAWESNIVGSIVPGESGENDDTEIFLYKYSPPFIAQIMEEPAETGYVPIENGIPVVNLSGGIIQVTENDYNDSSPKLNNNGIVVWYSWYPNDGTEGVPKPEIFLYDSKKGIILQITNDEYTDWFPEISDLDYVVWMGYDGHDWEIYLYDYRAGTTTQLTDNAYDDEFPHISSHFVVWQGKVDNQYEIFRAIIGR